MLVDWHLLEDLFTYLDGNLFYYLYLFDDLDLPDHLFYYLDSNFFHNFNLSDHLDGNLNHQNLLNSFFLLVS